MAEETLTSLWALVRQTGPGHELSVQVVNLCVLAEQKLLEAADLNLQVTRRAVFQLKTHTKKFERSEPVDGHRDCLPTRLPAHRCQLGPKQQTP